jgi:hypothetical protein
LEPHFTKRSCFNWIVFLAKFAKRAKKTIQSSAAIFVSFGSVPHKAILVEVDFLSRKVRKARKEELFSTSLRVLFPMEVIMVQLDYLSRKVRKARKEELFKTSL